MDKDLLQPAATIAAQILSRVTTSDGQMTDDVIAAAFEQAYRGLELARRRLHAKAPAAHVSPLKM
jgi:hypothetical protein